jgi:hypothetical protein
MLPQVKERLLDEVFGYLSVNDQPIGQSIENPMVALVQWFHGPGSPFGECLQQGLITQFIERP